MSITVARPLLAASDAQSELLVERALRLRRTQIGLAIAVLVVSVAIFGPYFAPYNPNDFVNVPFASPGPTAFFGTDDLGRDVWSRFLYGGRTILLLASIATTMGVALGVLIGLSAAYARNPLDDVLMRSMDVFLAFPPIMLALVAIATVGTQLWLIVITVASAAVPRVARVIRGAAIPVVERDFIGAADALGESHLRIIAFEVLPNVMAPLVAEGTIRMAYAIGLMASLAFLGFTSDPNAADWGLMVQENATALPIQPWGALLPVLAIALLIIGTGLVGDGLARASIGIDRDGALSVRHSWLRAVGLADAKIEQAE